MNLDKSSSSRYSRDKRSPVPSNEARSRIMSSIKAKNTKPELMVRRTLWREGLKGYRLHWKKAPGRPDICFPGKKIAIFVHGCYWHRCPHCQPAMPRSNTDFWRDKFKKNMERDTRKVLELENDGWKILTIWECEVKQAEIYLDKVKTLFK